MKITVLYDKKTGKIYPHGYNQYGEIIITVSGHVTEELKERLIVSNIDTNYIDTLNWYVLDHKFDE